MKRHLIATAAVTVLLLALLSACDPGPSCASGTEAEALVLAAAPGRSGGSGGRGGSRSTSRHGTSKHGGKHRTGGAGGVVVLPADGSSCG